MVGGLDWWLGDVSPGTCTPTVQGTALEQCDRAHVQVEGRFVSVLRARDGLHCIDSVCYHTGGPLTIGDIEETAVGRKESPRTASGDVSV